MIDFFVAVGFAACVLAGAAALFGAVWTVVTVFETRNMLERADTRFGDLWQRVEVLEERKFDDKA